MKTGAGTAPFDDAGAGPEGSTTPAIAGFDLHPTQGSWWEFGSSYDWNGGNPVHHDSKFVLTLGAPTTIAGDAAFPVTFTLVAGTKSDSFVWKYLSFVGSRIRGSVDGATYETLFDARTGKWPATNDGLFGNLRHGSYPTVVTYTKQ